MGDSWRPDRSEVERLARAQLSMTPGTAIGRVASASPVRSLPRQSDGSGEVVEAIFSYATTPTVNIESPPYFNRTPNADVGTIIVNTRSNTTSSTTVAILINGSQVASIVLPSGNHQSAEELVEDVVAEYGDQISVKCTSVGAGLVGLVVQILLEEG